MGSSTVDQLRTRRGAEGLRRLPKAGILITRQVGSGPIEHRIGELVTTQAKLLAHTLLCGEDRIPISSIDLRVSGCRFGNHAMLRPRSRVVQVEMVTKAGKGGKISLEPKLNPRHLRRRRIIIRRLEYTIGRDTTYGRVSRDLCSFLYKLFPELYFFFFRPP